MSQRFPEDAPVTNGSLWAMLSELMLESPRPYPAEFKVENGDKSGFSGGRVDFLVSIRRKTNSYV